jgi:hypothetical protein
MRLFVGTLGVLWIIASSCLSFEIGTGIHMVKASRTVVQSKRSLAFVLRGGATVVDEDEEEEVDLELESEESDEEEEVILGVEESDEEEEEVDVEEEDDKELQREIERERSLAASALKASAKIIAKKQSQKTAASKEAVNTKLLKKPVKIRVVKKSIIPYIIRACFNPGTVIRMTIAYWQSLFNLDYLKNKVRVCSVSTVMFCSDLRSARLHILTYHDYRIHPKN